MSDESENIARLIARAKEGDRDSLGQLLDSYRDYLRLLSRIEVGRHLQGKVDASDIVQAAFLDAHRQFPNFRGSQERQLLAWLKTILAGALSGAMRHYLGTRRRDARLEQSLVDDLDHSTCALANFLADPHSSPSQHAIRGEQSRHVADALSRLPDDYQTVLILRHLEGLTFPQVAQSMQRSVDSVEKLWLRGLTRLRKEFVTEAT